MRLKGFAALLAWVGLSSFTSSALPCGAFVSVREKRVPSLAVEQTLIVFDAERELEHFVRQIVIRDPSPGFGFVVPVPEQPQVAKVKKEPFTALAQHFPPRSGLGIVSTRGGGGGLTSAGARPPVTVLSKERVGSFTAFVLAATDATALERWLKDNQLVVPPETRAWLDHYVKRRFYFAALRYELDAKARGQTRAETLRISFKTPLPFYPYFEPTHAGSAQAERDLAVWLVASRDHVPVSLKQGGGGAAWVRPLKEHYSSSVTRAQLDALFDAELTALFPAPKRLSLQVFEDQKRSRAGFGDIVMVPKQPTPLGSLALERSLKLMASLDPAVTP